MNNPVDLQRQLNRLSYIMKEEYKKSQEQHDKLFSTDEQETNSLKVNSMYRFKIRGYEGNGSSYYSSNQYSAVLFANNLDEALEKAKNVFGFGFSTTNLEIDVEEMGEQYDNT